MEFGCQAQPEVSQRGAAALRTRLDASQREGRADGLGDGDMGRAQRLGLLKTSDAPVGSPCEREALIGQRYASLLRVPSEQKRLPFARQSRAGSQETPGCYRGQDS